jgi:xylulokinase
MRKKVVLAHDMGTSADKAVLVTVTGEILDSVTMHYPLSHPQPTWAEQNPEDWWKAVGTTTRAVLRKARLKAEDVVAVIFSSQTQVMIPLDGSGKPLRPALSWLDGRSADTLREELWTAPRVMGYNLPRLMRYIRVTGGSPGQTGKDQIGKILWLRRHEPDVFRQAVKFVDAKDYINFRLTGSLCTSVDIAYLWWFMDSRKMRNRWDPRLCRLGAITPDRLAEIRESVAVVGRITREAARHTGLAQGTPVVNGCGDLAASALGSGSLGDGELFLNLGTSGWVAGHVTKRKIDIPHYTGCIGSAWPQKYYLGMAHQETAGVCLEWLKNKVLYHEKQLKKESRVGSVYEILDRLAEKAGPGAGGLMFTPWMFGERCPIDDEFARAGLYNIGLNHSREHMVRAVFEGIAFNSRWAMETIEAMYRPVPKLNFTGGVAQSDVWCQIIADVMNREIHRVSNPQQAGARGIALLASLAMGYIESFESIANHIKIDRVFRPNPSNRQLYDRLFREYRNIHKQNKGWFRRMNQKSS